MTPFYRSWWFALLMGSLAQFLAWCVVDVFYVRYGLREVDHLVFVGTPLVLLANMWLLRPQPSWLLTSVGVALLSTAAAFVLVLYLGVWFHFAIGGRL